MLKIGSCTILYNPNEEVIGNLKTYIKQVDVSVVIDNSDKHGSISGKIKEIPGLYYINMEGNQGIATALNHGFKFLQQHRVDYVLTMDQDSRFPTEQYNDILKLVEKFGNQYSIVGLNFNFKTESYNQEIVEVPYWLTSGNFVNINDYFDVGGFDEKLFIDYVDIEFGYKLYRHNLKICYLKSYSLEHEIGHPIPINILGKTYYAMNHTAIRYYYRYRNAFYLFMQDKNFFKKEFLKEMLVNIPKMLLYETDKKRKMQMICKAFKDARLNKMGKYEK